MCNRLTLNKVYKSPLIDPSISDVTLPGTSIPNILAKKLAHSAHSTHYPSSWFYFTFLTGPYLCVNWQVSLLDYCLSPCWNASSSKTRSCLLITIVLLICRTVSDSQSYVSDWIHNDYFGRDIRILWENQVKKPKFSNLQITMLSSSDT